MTIYGYEQVAPDNKTMNTILFQAASQCANQCPYVSPFLATCLETGTCAFEGKMKNIIVKSTKTLVAFLFNDKNWHKCFLNMYS